MDATGFGELAAAVTAESGVEPSTAAKSKPSKRMTRNVSKNIALELLTSALAYCQ